MKHSSIFLFLLALSQLFSAHAQSLSPVTFSYNGSTGADGSAQTYTVPTGVYNLSIVAFGAAGGDGLSTYGGKGGQVDALLKVTPGQQLTIYVGGTPPAFEKGYNGGGQGAATSVSRHGGGGGGATDVRLNGSALSNRVLVAGGGGDITRAFSTDPGGGGGLTGGNAGLTIGGKGGTQTAGGTGGAGSIRAGQAGSLGVGGDGFVSGNYISCAGGGGYYGGGSGGDEADGNGAGGIIGSGGGGSSYTDPTYVTSVTHTQGVQSGSGQLTITPLSNLSLTATASPSSVCVGSTVALSVAATGGAAPYSYTWAAPSGITLSATNTSAVSASVGAGVSGVQTLTVTVASVGGAPSSARLVSLTVNAPPSVSITPSSTAICAGQSAQLTASGATSYTWSTGQTINPISVNTTGSYSVTGVTAAGCSGMATASVTVNTPVSLTVEFQTAPTVCGTATTGHFGVNVTGTPPFSFKLLKENSLLDQTTNSTGTVDFTQPNLQSGNYQIVVSNACNSLTTTFAPVVANPLPTPYAVTGGGAYCQGGSGVLIGLAGSQSDVNYQLLLNGNAVGSPLAGTGSAISFGNQTTAGTYTLRATNATTACQQTMNGSAVITINALPTAYTVTGGGAFCAGSSGVAVSLSGSQTGVNYQLLLNGNAVGSSVAGTGSGLNFGNQTTGGSYSIRATNASTSCQQTMTGSVTVTVNPLPMVYAVTGGGAYCAGSNGIAVGLSGSQTGINYQLRRDGTNVGNPVAGTGNSFSFGNQTTAGTYTVLATNPTTTCQQPMSGSAVVTVTPLPNAPTLVTASGYPYPAGQPNLTLSQNVGPVSLTVLGCSEGMIMANGNAASSFTVSTAMTGTQTYTATCTQNGCTSPAGSFQLTVVPPTLSVLHQDADYGNLTNNIIKPYLELANAGGQAIPYGEVTVRYWFTSEGNAPPTNLAVYYAQLGAVSMNYVALSQPRQGAYGYVEYSFPGGGSLAGNGNSGPIENGIQKTDGSNFNESDDYSYQANYQDYVPNRHITAYRKGVIFYGQEPTVVASQTAVQVYSQAQDQTTTSQIQTRLELRNPGNVALPVASLKLRYYFTSDNGQVPNVNVDYADMGASNVQARVIKLAAPVNGADSYVELSFPGNTMQLNALSSLGAIDFRLVRSDYGLFDQSNDYSYAPNYGSVGLNGHVTAYLNNTLIFGTPPSGAPARVATLEPSSMLQAKVLGNPVVGSSAEIEITGVAGQPVSLKLVDLQGRAIHEQRIEQAGETERVSLPLGTNRGQLLLKVNTDSQQQSLKLLRP